MNRGKLHLHRYTDNDLTFNASADACKGCDRAKDADNDEEEWAQDPAPDALTADSRGTLP